MMNDFERVVERIKQTYPEGTRIELINMLEPYSIKVGTRGTVDFVDDLGYIFIEWDNGKTSLLPRNDDFRFLSNEEIKQEKSQDCVNKIKEHYSNGNIEKAVECWNKLFDLYETPDMPLSEELSQIITNNSRQLLSYTRQIDDKTAFAITDYLKDQENRKKGYYNDNIIKAENLSIGDVVLSNNGDNHKWQVVDIGKNITFKDLDAETYGDILNKTKIVCAYENWGNDKYELVSKAQEKDETTNDEINEEPDICE